MSSTGTSSSSGGGPPADRRHDAIFGALLRECFRVAQDPSERPLEADDVEIDSNGGRPESVETERRIGSRALDESALATVRASWRFAPARRNGVPVPATVLVPVRFELMNR